MRENPDFRWFAYGVIALGALSSFAAALVPHYATGYRLHLGVLFAGLLPWIVYAVFSDVVRGWGLLATGALLLGVQLGVVVPQRFLHYDGYAGGRIYYTAIIMTLVIVIVLGLAARRERRWWGAKKENAGKT